MRYIRYPGMFFLTNPFKFLSEVQDLIKAKNFFETRVIEYQSSGALSDDF